MISLLSGMSLDNCAQKSFKESYNKLIKGADDYVSMEKPGPLSTLE